MLQQHVLYEQWRWNEFDSGSGAPIRREALKKNNFFVVPSTCFGS